MGKTTRLGSKGVLLSVSCAVLLTASMLVLPVMNVNAEDDTGTLRIAVLQDTPDFNMFNLGTCYYYLGRTDEALGQYETVERSTLATTHQRDALGNQITILGNNFLASGQALIPEEPPSHLEVGADGIERRIPDPVPVPSLIARWQEAELFGQVALERS